MIYLGVDPGEKRIGLAISDEGGNFARPLSVINRSSYSAAAEHILQIVSQRGINLIIIGQSFDENGQPSYLGRQSARLAEAIREKTSIPIKFWDEAFSTADAIQARHEMGSRKNRSNKNLDASAAALMLQTYLDAKEG